MLLSPGCGIAETHFEAAERLLEAGQDTEARRALELEIAIRPANLEARYNLAVLLERIDHNKDAASLYRENIKLGRHLPSVVNLSAWYRKLGLNYEAEALLQQAVHQFPDEAVPWYLLADMAESKGNNKQASAYFQNALTADNKNGFAHLRFAQFLESDGQAKQALDHTITAAALLPDCAPCLDMAADILARNGRKKQALELWQHSIAIEPSQTVRKKIVQARGDGL